MDVCAFESGHYRKTMKILFRKASQTAGGSDKTWTAVLYCRFQTGWSQCRWSLLHLVERK